MEMIGIAYPFSLGSGNKNKLQKQGSIVKRWININHEDWDFPVWKMAKCKANLVDRSLGPKKYAYLESDIAVMTEYEDPILNMIIYDLVPCKSAAFDTKVKPPNDLNLVYDWTILGNIEDVGFGEPALGEGPAKIERNVAYPVMAAGGLLFLFNYFMQINDSVDDPLEENL